MRGRARWRPPPRRPAPPKTRRGRDRALEADLKNYRAAEDRVLQGAGTPPRGRAGRRSAKAKERAIAAAEERLGEIEERRTAPPRSGITAAERRAEEAEKAVAAESARAREGAAAWLRERIDQDPGARAAKK